MVVVATISGKAVLITGGNRGIGRALVADALDRGARRVYVGTRKPLPDNDDPRVTPLNLDITSAAHRRARLSRSMLSTSSSTTPALRITTT